MEMALRVGLLTRREPAWHSARCASARTRARCGSPLFRADARLAPTPLPVHAELRGRARQRSAFGNRPSPPWAKAASAGRVGGVSYIPTPFVKPDVYSAILDAPNRFGEWVQRRLPQTMVKERASRDRFLVSMHTSVFPREAV